MNKKGKKWAKQHDFLSKRNPKIVKNFQVLGSGGEVPDFGF